MDEDWSFHLGEVNIKIGNSHGDIYGTSKAGSVKGPPQSDFDTSDTTWQTVNIPHDWSVRQPFDKAGAPSWGYKPKGCAWYRKCFYIPEEFKGKNIALDFDGVAKNTEVYLNGSLMKRNFTGYAPFTVDISDRAQYGLNMNTLAVFVDASQWEGWWYEGAGIYRHAWLVITNKIHVDKYGIFVHPEKADDYWNVNIDISVNNTEFSDEMITVQFGIISPDNKEILTAEQEILAKSYCKTDVKFTEKYKNPLLWDIDSPNLYKCVVKVLKNGNEIDCDSANFGFRTISVDSKKGFFLNGKHVKLFGTCNHQDHGGIGVAVPDSIHEYRIQRLKDMGTNAYRCAHGMPHKELLDACDKLGMLVIDENRSFETSDEKLDELRKMVLRDRNHPSVIMYSIFNEEPLQGTSDGKIMAERMRHEIHLFDNTKFVTGAMNGSILEENGAAQAVDICGVNYQILDCDDFHNKFPDVPMVGSETTSTFGIRGCYETNRDKNEISSYDEDPADWGNTVRQTWDYALNRDFCLGAFMWTGFDYLGEPTPFVWPSVSSFFGMMDSCGFPKDAYYLCQAIFKQEPIVHVLPHWNWKGKEGENIRVMSHTNCNEAELFVNGKSFGKQTNQLTKQSYWNVPYEQGELKLVGYNDGVPAGECIRETTGDAVAVVIKPWRNYMFNDGKDAIPINFIALDNQGREVPDANFAITIKAKGGEFLGTCNGNPNCHEDFTSSVISLFNGRCQGILRCFNGSETLTVSIECDKINCKPLHLEIKYRDSLSYIETVKEMSINNWKVSAEIYDNKPDPFMVVNSTDNNSFEAVTVVNGSLAKMNDKIGKYILYRANINVPLNLNNYAPALKFHGLWGRCSIYIGDNLVKEVEHQWSGECTISLEGFTGKQTINVVVKSLSEYGAGITAAVVVR